MIVHESRNLHGLQRHLNLHYSFVDGLSQQTMSSNLKWKKLLMLTILWVAFVLFQILKASYFFIVLSVLVANFLYDSWVPWLMKFDNLFNGMILQPVPRGIGCLLMSRYSSTSIFTASHVCPPCAACLKPHTFKIQKTILY